jgi:hypothetical protein
MTKPPTMQHGHSNDFQTPPWVLDPLYPYIGRMSVWECACGNGNLVFAMKKRGLFVRATDILTGCDFLEDWTKADFFTSSDCIITNPPYSLKNKFLEKCYLSGRPFALLLPLTTLETPFRQNLFRKYGVEIIFLPRRVEFETPSGKGTGSWFATAWFTHGFNIGRELTFWEQ